MKADVTRHLAIDPSKHYVGVLHQQGRVWLDSDWNEDVLQRLHLLEQETQDIVGGCGSPDPGTSFQITGNANDPTDFQISGGAGHAGRYYVDGIVAQLDAPTTYKTQPDFPVPPPIRLTIPESGEVRGLVYLEVWQRLVTYLEDGAIREVALGGPDTATRLKTIAQVKLYLPSNGQELSCETSHRFMPGSGSGTLTTLQPRNTQPTDPCQLPDPANYTGRENHLYRVEVHDGGQVIGNDTLGLIWTQKLAQDSAINPSIFTLASPLTQVQIDALMDSGAALLSDDSGHSETVTVASVDSNGTNLTLVTGVQGTYTVANNATLRGGVARFKWSRDNASFAVQVTAVSADRTVLTLSNLGRDQATELRLGDLVEIDDDASEVGPARGHLTYLTHDPDPDLLTVNLAESLPSQYHTDRHLTLRRWDGIGWAQVTFDETGTPSMDLQEGVHIQFGGSDLRPGDFWQFAARSADGTVEELASAPPTGIVRHRCPLAVIHWQNRSVADTDGRGQPQPNIVDIEDCRNSFPPLTHICAEDVCFDNDRCNLVDVVTVQDALERLCEEKDLRFHNKHLHGWGIVCGLQVVCGPDRAGASRAHVTIKSGYAIDCEGSDINVDTDEAVDILKMIDNLGADKAEAPVLNTNGHGEVCLILALDQTRKPVYRLEKYDPAQNNDFEAIFAGTLLLDFYNDCIKNVQDFLRDQLTPPPGEQNRPAGPVTQRVAALTNLTTTVVNPQTGQRIFLSPREDVILRDFYQKLRALLQSDTFCAMFDHARPYPDYPTELAQTKMDTIFGKNFHERLRLRPGGLELYSTGPGISPLHPSTTINRYDLQKNRLISQIDPLAGTVLTGQTATDTGSGAVQDVAFSPDGRRIYVIASTRNDENTFFRVGVFDGQGNISWQPVVTICGVKLVTLATTAADSSNVYAIGMTRNSNNQVRGAGLYKINPDNVDPNMHPIKPFNSVGHLVITADGRAFATEQSADVAPTSYNSIVGVSVPNVSTGAFEGGKADRISVTSGSDDLAVFTQKEGARVDTLYWVTGPVQGVKTIQGYEIATGSFLDKPVTIPNTVVRLAPYTPTGMLLVTLEDGYDVIMIDLKTNALVPNYLLPTQVGPLGIAADTTNQRVMVLNYASNTITTAPGVLFDSNYKFPFAALIDYRKQALEAFSDLAAGFLQYLKDCLCDHFLVHCPECTGTEKLYLGCISVRNKQVYKVCNFSRRRYVKSFPTVGYWLSLVPIVPMISRVISEFCCLVLPELFRYTVPDFNANQADHGDPRVRVSTVRNGVAQAQSLNVSSLVGGVLRQMGLVGDVLGTLVSQPPASVASAATRVSTADIVGQPVDTTETMLTARGIAVRRVAFDPASDSSLAESLVGSFRPPAPGSLVTLYEEAGQVRYYSVSSIDPTALKLQGQVATLSDSVAARGNEIQTLRTTVDAQQAVTADVNVLKATLSSTQEQLAARDQQLATLSTQLQSLERSQTELAARVDPVRVAQMEAELNSLRSFREEVTRFMQRPNP